MTPNQVISEVRSLIQDSAQPTRNTDPVLLGFLSQTLNRMAVMRPDLFTTVQLLQTKPHQVLQEIPAEGIQLVDVFSVQVGLGGRPVAVSEASREVYDKTLPSWVGDKGRMPVHFMRYVKNSRKFFLYPQPKEDVYTLVEYSRLPAYEDGSTILSAQTYDKEIRDLSNSYLPVVVDGVVFLAESIDDEHVLSQRAVMFRESFMGALNATLEAKVIAGLSEEAAATPQGGGG